MYEFNSIQEALNYIFEDKNITIINIPGSPHPWFIVDEIRNVLEYAKNNNTEFTRNLNFRDEVLAVLNIHDLRDLEGHTMNDGVTSRLCDINLYRPTIMIISLPGLFELLVKSRMPKAKEFQHWLYFIVLPTLYHNPQLVNQINDLNKELADLKFALQNVTKMGTEYQIETYRLRRNYNDLADKHNNLVNGYNTLSGTNRFISNKYAKLEEDYSKLQDVCDNLLEQLPSDMNQEEDYVYTLSV